MGQPGVNLSLNEASSRHKWTDLSLNGTLCIWRLKRANLRLKGADLRLIGANLRLKGADLRLKESDLRLKLADVRLNRVDMGAKMGLLEAQR